MFDWRIGLILCVGLIVFFAINSGMMKASAGMAKRKQEKDSALIGKVIEYIQGIRISSSFLCRSEQCAYPRGKRGCRREYYKQFQQLALYVEAVLSALERAFRFREIMLKELEFHQQEVIKANHVIDLVNGKYCHKTQKELPEIKTASEAVPYRNDPDSRDHQKAEYNKCPP